MNVSIAPVVEPVEVLVSFIFSGFNCPDLSIVLRRTRSVAMEASPVLD
jgi:hypothetical protein